VTNSVIQIRKGKKEFKRFDIAENASRQQVSLNYFGIYGVNPGPNLLLNAAVHGNEVVGVEVVRKIVERINPDELSGNLLAFPILNPMAFNSEERWDPYDKQDMNRIFPGDPGGTLTERLAHFFFHQFVPLADYMIDLHSAEFPDEMLPHIRIRVKDPCDHYWKMVYASGIEVIWKGPTIVGMLQTEANKKGIPCITIEIGAADLVTEKNVAIGIRSVENIMKVLGMIKGKAIVPSQQISLASNEEWIRTHIGGIYKPDIELGAMIYKGQKIGDILDPTSFEMDNIMAPINGLVTGITHRSIVRSGTRLAMLVDFDPEKLTSHLIGVPQLRHATFVENSCLMTLKLI